ncbi:hypothetical protein M703_08305 [Neisseria gonorrhoeae SK29344]|nr:hypothetical protein T556_01075 [Neisseria gonorrhoeae NG-k51.05]KLR95417.1 hypothetical protein M685_07995 [Neisseria gonorrhoeae SK16259]KLS10095.1 hypothetical protein M703_08305 [Neisseria gonorrhoeae SK29344]KLS10562.1 hypothetical protein M716_00160 [Neisseria gonorrhoeae SK32402]KLS25413.1 hypothetical protein M733_11885 [Neisseria gonorrhoeae ATL_2011_05-13]KLS39385.1 hypothetical protein M724_07900 [Neisseria gonorrhoeae ATL_2011_01_05]KLS59762.1 hypothetical protein M743_11005 [N
MNRHSRAGGNPERGTAAIFKGCLKIQRFQIPAFAGMTAEQFLLFR